VNGFKTAMPQPEKCRPAFAAVGDADLGRAAPRICTSTERHDAVRAGDRGTPGMPNPICG